jgi:hypothetical protein
MIFLSLAVWVLSAYADEKAASTQNFTTAINQYLQAHPPCVEIRAGEQNKFPLTIVLNKQCSHNNDAIIFAFLAKLGLLTA